MEIVGAPSLRASVRIKLGNLYKAHSLSLTPVSSSSWWLLIHFNTTCITFCGLICVFGRPVGLEVLEGEDQDFDSQQGSVTQCPVDAQHMFGHYHDSNSILARSLLAITEMTLTWISHFFSIHSFYCMCRVQNVTLEVTEIWGWLSMIWGQCGSTRSPLQCQVEQTPRSWILVFSQQAPIPVCKTSSVSEGKKKREQITKKAKRQVPFHAMLC